MSNKLALVLDAGTTGIKALVFKASGEIVAKSARTIAKKISAAGVQVEQDANDILTAATEALREVVAAAGLTTENCAGLGLTNQRETVVVWSKISGQPIYPAIVWEDSRTKDECATLAPTYSQLVREKTGLTLDSYFSASKIAWILAHAAPADTSQLLAGTIDTWLLWNLLEGRPHLTDYTNASRTLLFNIKTKTWDEELLKMWRIPAPLLPEVKHSLALFGTLDAKVLGWPLPLLAVCGDQQASFYAAREAGAAAKITYGTGTFIMSELGAEFKLQDGFFTTLAAAPAGPIYALEAKVGTYAARIDALLAGHEPLDEVVSEMTAAAGQVLNKLTPPPAKIILDGGITQAPTLLAAQQAANPELNFTLQQPFDGTALGISQMVFAAH